MRLKTSWSRYLCFALTLAAVVITSPARSPADPAMGRKPPAAPASSANSQLQRAVASDSSSRPAQASQARLLEAYGKLPLSFEVNQGQADRRVKFLSRGSGCSLFLTGSEAVLTLRKSSPLSKAERAKPSRSLTISEGQLQRASFGTAAAKLRSRPLPDARNKTIRSTDSVVRMRFVGANPEAKVSGLEELPGRSNYFIGRDPRKWHSNVPNYARVKYTNVYSGVDLVYYGDQRQLEYDFVVKPGADPHRIALALQFRFVKSNNHSALRIDRDGDLVVGSDAGEVRLHKPVVYQAATADAALTTVGITSRHFVQGKYLLKGNRITFEVASYDKTKPLVIDPVLAYSTYLGGSGGDGSVGIAVDASGNAYVTGWTGTDFPTTAGAFQTSYSGGASDAFISKLNPTGSALVYSTYLGGSGDDGEAGFFGNRIAVDASGNAYIVGSTNSSDFPTTPGASQTILAGGYDAFITKLNAGGASLLYSTYLGGSNDDFGLAIAVDVPGHASVTGYTRSADFPTTPGAFQTTFVGGSDVGVDAFVSKLNAGGSALVYSTYLGGGDGGEGIAVDASGHAYVTGFTQSSNFPVTPGAFQTIYGGGSSLGDAFISKLNAAGSAIVYSTYLGGSGDDDGFGIVIDASGNAFVTGLTYSSNFPTTPDALQATFGGGPNGDAFVSKLNAVGSAPLYSTYLGGPGGGQGLGIAVGGPGSAYLTGFSSSTFPVTPGAFQTTFADAFVCKFSFAGVAFSRFGGGLLIDPDAGVFYLSGGFKLGPGGSIDPSTEPVTFSVGSYSVTLPPGSFVKYKTGYVYQKTVNHIFLCVFIKFTSMPGSYKLLANRIGGTLSTTTSPVPVTLAIGNDSGTAQLNARFN
jgi:hypothetical protein